MSFYNPMQAGPDIGGGLQELMSQFMMMKLISQMYPGKTKEELSTSPLPEKRDVKEIFHSLGLNPGDETTEIGESELPGQRRVGSYVHNKNTRGIESGWHGFAMNYPWLVSDLLRLYPPGGRGR